MEKIKIRGLALCSSIIFFVWGVTVVLKGFYDAFIGEPEANYFSPEKWDFVTRQQWMAWSGFEITYGFACIGMFFALRKYAASLPEYIERPVKKIDFKL